MKLYRTMPPALQANVYGGGTWFEEDVEWALVALAFPQHFDARQIAAAVSTINYYKEPGTPYHAAFTWLHTTDQGAERIKQATEHAARAAVKTEATL